MLDLNILSQYLMDKGFFKESLSITFFEKNAAVVKKINIESPGEKLNLKLQDIIDLEEEIYPPEMRTLSDALEIDDMQSFIEKYDYLEDDLDFNIDSLTSEQILITGSKNKWYLILEREGDTIEVVDMAAKENMLPVFKIINFFDKLKESGIYKIKMDTRESTSYPLIKALIKRKRLKHKEKKPWIWGMDKMYPITIYL
jgi:hypothetical protein